MDFPKGHASLRLMANPWLMKTPSYSDPRLAHAFPDTINFITAGNVK